MSHVFRLVLFAVLFVMLCAKASELCSAGSRTLAKGLFAGSAVSSPAGTNPEPLKSRALEFRGLTPLPLSSGSGRPAGR